MSCPTVIRVVEGDGTRPIVVRVSTSQGGNGSCPAVVRVASGQGPPGIGLPAGTADAGKFVRKLGATPYAYELVTPDAVGLPQGLAPINSPIFVGLTLSGIAANRLLFTGADGVLTGVSLGSGLSIVDGALVVGASYPSLSVPTGFSVTGSGTASISIGFAAGYSLPTTASQSSWNAAALLAGTAVQPNDLAPYLSEAEVAATYVAQGAPVPTLVAVRNNSGATLTIGTPVYVTGSSGTSPTVAAADASTEATAARTIGLMYATAAHNSDGIVITHGLLAGVTTSPLTEGQIIWLSETTGQLISTRPTQPAHGVFMGFCIKQGPGTSGILYVNVINGQELEELHDVLISGATTGQVLALAADGQWKNKTLAAGDVGADPTGTAAAAVAAHAAAVDPHPNYLTPAEGNAAYATAAQGAKADTAVQPATLTGYVQTGDSRLSDAREWSAATATQAEAEAGTGTTRLAFTPLRVFQAIAAWWAASAAKTKLDGIATGATANQTDSFLLSRTNHTGTQPASTITGLAASATTDTTDAGNISSGTLGAARLPASGVSPGAYGSSSQVPVLTVDATGRLTAVTLAAVSGGGGGAVRIDSTSTANTIYVGKAPAGSAESAAVWTITRSQFSAAGVQTGSSTVSAVTWTGRTSHTYP